MMNIVVYCGANAGKDPAFAEAAKKLGQWICDQGHTLVFGGGKVGLMGIIADTVRAGGQKTIGVMPTFLIERELAHPQLNQLIVVDTMHERKLKMIELGDVYIALPGGWGTLEEFSEVISWSRIGQHNNPCILVNTHNFYGGLVTQFKDMVTAGFLMQVELESLLVSDSIEQFQPFIDAHQGLSAVTYTR